MYTVTRIGCHTEKGVHRVHEGNREVALVYDGYHGTLSGTAAREAAEHLARCLNDNRASAPRHTGGN